MTDKIVCDGVRLNSCVMNLRSKRRGQNVGDDAVQMWRTKKTVQGKGVKQKSQERNDDGCEFEIQMRLVWYAI